MRASLFEVWKLSQRTLEAAGVPDGHDREGAFAVQWLCERGFPGFHMFGEAKPEIASIWSLSIEGKSELQATGSPLVSSGVDVIDFCAAAAMAAKQGTASVVVRAARGGLFLIPFAARRCANGGTCRLQWSVDGTEIDAVVGGAEAIWVDTPATEEQGLCDLSALVDITVTFDTDGAALRAGDGVPVGALLNPEKLRARRTRCLDQGVEIEVSLWDRMVTAARTVLVPTTQQSRELGAGGGDAND